MSGLRRAGVLGISLTLLLAGLALAFAAGPVPIDAPFFFPAVLLLPLYFLAERRRLDFEFRKDSVSVSLTQLPLVLGVLLAPLGLHLVLRLLASVTDGALVRRIAPSKLLFNAAVGAFEIGLASFVLGMAPSTSMPTSTLWLGLFVALLVADVVNQLALQAILALLGRRMAATDILQPLAVGAATSLVFTGIAVIAISAAWTDPTTIIITLGLAVALGLAYRGYRRQSERERSTDSLYSFVKDLKPVSIHSPDLRNVLNDVRLLLHSRFLCLSTCDRTSGVWSHLVTWDEDEAAPPPELAANLSFSTSPLDRASGAGDGQRMSTPLVGSDGAFGVLTAEQRLGSVRGFEMGDLRLLETVGTELATALERGRLLEDLRRSATTDALTGLPNLGATTVRVEELIGERGHGVVVIAVAVDSFREVNDTLGHEVGDALLVEVASRLTAAAPGAVVGRIGGGRFALALPATGIAADAAMFGLALRAGVEGSAEVGSVATHVRLSVGCALSPEHGSDAATLLRRSETAMSSARLSGGGPVLWEPAYEVEGQRRLAVVTALREALVSGAIGVAYQPKLAASSGVVTGMEALARWSHPALGPIGPDEFIPLAEASGLMAPLTSSVLRQSLQACRAWQRGGVPVGVAVNVNAETVLEPGFVTEVASLLASTGVAAELLTIELTESIVLRDPALAVERMGELQAVGVKLAIDDFGTGYSSLTYLKGLPVDEIKIDKGFVDGLTTEPSDRAVVRAVVDIAHTLGLRVVAEGVEQEAQQGILRALGVDEVQGYLYSRPMALAETMDWIEQRATHPHGHLSDSPYA